MTPSSPPTVGFAVLYRWRTVPGQEEAMRDAWRRLTLAIADRLGGLGSRLHQLEDGWFAAYAQWPDRATWLAGQAAPSPDPKASADLAATIGERLEPLELHPTDDLLVRDRP